MVDDDETNLLECHTTSCVQQDIILRSQDWAMYFEAAEIDYSLLIYYS